MEKQQPDFRLSSDSKALAEKLLTVSVGETITYQDMSAIIGRSVQSIGRGALETARSIVQREKRIVFGVIRGVGLIRLNDSEIIDLADKAREHSRRHARRVVKKLICVEYSSLKKESQIKHNAAISMFGAISEISSTSSIKRLEKQIEETGSEIPAAKAAIAALGCI